TVGWFTTIFPVWLSWDDNGVAAALQSIRAQVEQIPNRGIGFGLLRYLRESEELKASLRVLPRPEVSFNYLGQFGQPGPDSLISVIPADLGAYHGGNQVRKHLIDINCWIQDGTLQSHWIYGTRRLRRESVAKVAHDFLAALQRVISQTVEPGGHSYTPSD